jgi:hypothetical protein
MKADELRPLEPVDYPLVVWVCAFACACVCVWGGCTETFLHHDRLTLSSPCLQVRTMQMGSDCNSCSGCIVTIVRHLLIGTPLEENSIHTVCILNHTPLYVLVVNLRNLSAEEDNGETKLVSQVTGAKNPKWDMADYNFFYFLFFFLLPISIIESESPLATAWTRHNQYQLHFPIIWKGCLLLTAHLEFSFVGPEPGY